MVYAQVKPNVFKQVKMQLLKEYEDYEKPAQVYAGLTAFCFLLDLISSFILLGSMGSASKIVLTAEQVEAQNETIQAEGGTDTLTNFSSGVLYIEQMLIVTIYICLDIYMALWAFFIKHRSNEPLNVYIMHAIAGVGTLMRE